jgi:hypothetical protein
MKGIAYMSRGCFRIRKTRTYDQSPPPTVLSSIATPLAQFVPGHCSPLYPSRRRVLLRPHMHTIVQYMTFLDTGRGEMAVGLERYLQTLLKRDLNRRRESHREGITEIGTDPCRRTYRGARVISPFSTA